MNKKSLKMLAALAIALIAILTLMQFRGDDSISNGELLFPDLKSDINSIGSLTITRADDATEITRDTEAWIISSRDGYPVNVGKLRQLLLQIADAKRIEQKTSNPDRYHQLGVRNPDIEGSKGVRLTLSGPDVGYEVIVGNLAQTGYRYVRIADDAQSWLIDQDPEIPDSVGDWLVKDIVDIKSADIRSVTIQHADGEEIRISKESAESTDFDVTDIPDGRELSYATVANGIAGVLNALTLDDVRKPTESEAETASTTFEKFDGTSIVVVTEKSDGEAWITLQAMGDDSTGTYERLAGWQFKIPEYKANQLTRRWEDILKAETDAE